MDSHRESVVPVLHDGADALAQVLELLALLDHLLAVYVAVDKALHCAILATLPIWFDRNTDTLLLVLVDFESKFGEGLRRSIDVWVWIALGIVVVAFVTVWALSTLLGSASGLPVRTGEKGVPVHDIRSFGARTVVDRVFVLFQTVVPTGMPDWLCAPPGRVVSPEVALCMASQTVNATPVVVMF